MAKKKKTDDGGGEDKPKGGKLKLIIGAILLLAIGAGGAYGAFAAGLFGNAGEPEGPDIPKLVAKGGEDPYAPPASDKDKEVGEQSYGEGGSEYRALYYNFKEGFTSNLKDSAGLIQVSLAVSTNRDGRVIQWLNRHELALRSAILIELAATPQEDVFTAEGKERLKKRLTKAINAVLVEQEGFGGVDSVYFQSFLVQ